MASDIWLRTTRVTRLLFLNKTYGAIFHSSHGSTAGVAKAMYGMYHPDCQMVVYNNSLAANMKWQQ